MSEDDVKETELQAFLREQKAAREKIVEARKEARRLHEASRKQASENCRKWYEQQREKAEIAAREILQWVERFLKSETWNKIFKFEPRIHYVDISETISYQHPVPDSLGTVRNSQRLYLKSNGHLFVCNYVKYGKSYEVTKLKDLLHYADPPTLVEAANMIRDGRVWEIIKESIREDLKAEARMLTDWDFD